MRRVILLSLVLISFAFIPLLVAGAAGFAALRPVFDIVIVPSFAAMALLMLWMLVETIRDERLSPRERLRWQLFLLVGGPITACVYLSRRLAPPRYVRG